MLRKSLIIWVTVAIFATTASAQGVKHVRGYVNRDGTYVAPYFRTNPDRTKTNNFSYPGNYNPNTGDITPGSPGRMPPSMRPLSEHSIQSPPERSAGAQPEAYAGELPQPPRLAPRVDPPRQDENSKLSETLSIYSLLLKAWRNSESDPTDEDYILLGKIASAYLNSMSETMPLEDHQWERTPMMMGGIKHGSPERHFIDALSKDGMNITLEDGSIWRVSAEDTPRAAKWKLIDRVEVGEGKLTNMENKESVKAARK